MPVEKEINSTLSDQLEIQFQSGTVFKVDSCYLNTIKNILWVGIDGFVTEETKY